MKNTIILIFSIISFSCVAQKKIASLNDNSVIKANNIKYMLTKSKDKVTIENSNNKWSNVKQHSPNIPINLNLFGRDIKLNVEQIAKICAAAIPFNELEELSRKKNSGLFITIKSDLKGNPLEVSFFTDENSILTLNQLEEIEANIKKSTKVLIKPEAERFIQGSNFLTNDTRILFTDILKIKKNYH